MVLTRSKGNHRKGNLDKSIRADRQMIEQLSDGLWKGNHKKFIVQRGSAKVMWSATNSASRHNSPHRMKTMITHFLKCPFWFSNKICPSLVIDATIKILSWVTDRCAWGKVVSKSFISHVKVIECSNYILTLWHKNGYYHTYRNKNLPHKGGVGPKTMVILITINELSHKGGSGEMVISTLYEAKNQSFGLRGVMVHCFSQKHPPQGDNIGFWPAPPKTFSTTSRSTMGKSSKSHSSHRKKLARMHLSDSSA